MPPEQRSSWMHGAIITASHVVAMQDAKKGDCIANWYLNDRQAKQKLIENTLAKYPTMSPSTIVIGLLTKACGAIAAPK